MQRRGIKKINNEQYIARERERERERDYEQQRQNIQKLRLGKEENRRTKTLSGVKTFGEHYSI